MIELEEVQILDVCITEFENCRFIKHLICVKRNLTPFVQQIGDPRVMEEQVLKFSLKTNTPKKN